MPPTALRTLGAFMQLSLDGYFCDPKGDMSFAHKPPDDAEWNAFVSGNAQGGGTLVFGRRTYEMMASWWPSPMAAKAMPEVAAAMNERPKLVFSRTLRSADWSNTTLIHDDAAETLGRMKGEPGPDMVILGSGMLVTRLADAGLIDALQVVVNPVALGAGKSLFSGLTRRLNFELVKTRAFANGTVVLWYAPAA